MSKSTDTGADQLAIDHAKSFLEQIKSDFSRREAQLRFDLSKLVDAEFEMLRQRLSKLEIENKL